MITLLTASSLEYQPLHAITRQSKVAYCERWGHQYLFRHHERVDCWERVEFWLEALDGCDWLFFMGADAMITNQAVDCAQFLDPDFEIVIGHDVNGINNDVFFLKNCADSRRFLSLVWAHKDRFANEQAAMSALWQQELWFRAKSVPQRQFNSMLYTEYSYLNKSGQWQDGDFVLHLPGLPLARRIELATAFNKTGSHA